MKLITRSRGENALRFGGIFVSLDIIFLVLFPIIFFPEANQGPLLGIFFMIPSFVIGIIIGALVKPNKTVKSK